ncbi:MAG: GldG family protein [Oscillospiraceae bacterium]|nr:GldG family protein [Oscillospiraceae bacterium]
MIKICKKFFKLFNKKKLKYGSVSVIFTAVFIAGVIMLNIIAGLILERFTIDLTAGQMFSIEENTAAFLAGIIDNVTITVCSRESDFTVGSANTREYYNQTNEILKRFASSSSAITLRYIDLMSNPDFVANYDRLSPGSVIIEAAGTGRNKILDANDYFMITYYDMRSGSQISEEEYSMYLNFGMGEMVHADVSAGAEGAFLSAVLSVTDVNPTHVGITTGFGESGNEHMETLLERNAYTLHEVDLVTGGIDGDLDFIIINTPAADYSLAAISRLAEWLDNNGEFGKAVLYVAHHSAETPNIDSFLEEWGIAVERSYVMQSDSRYTAPVPGIDIPFQYYNPLEFGDGLNPDYRILGEMMRHTHRVFEAWQNIETTPVLSSFDGAVVGTFEELEAGGIPDERGAYTVGVKSSKVRFEGIDVFSSDVIVFGGSNIFSPGLMAMRNSNNAEYFINMINELNGKGEVITVTPKSFAVATFGISAEQAGLIGLIFAVILPLVIIVTGVVIWIKRRHR